MAEGWDYIVVGGGSAGATVAARLSEHGEARVLLLEAGPDFESSETPAPFRGRVLGDGLTPEVSADEAPGFIWTDITCRRNPRQETMAYRRGRGLGGSSTINGLCAVRGVPDDFARWQATGLEGWSYDHVLWAYNKLESDSDYGDAVYHGDSGPTPIYREPESGWGGADRALCEAGADAGHPFMDDSNAPHTTGIGRFPMNIRDDKRVSTNDAYLEPARDRQNLEILGDAHVDRVIVEQGRATGVKLANGDTLPLNAGGEVILSAGAVHSPSILLRSGIGPAPLLGRIGVEVKADLPVGKGAQDHAMLFAELPVEPDAMSAVGSRPTNVILRYSSGIDGTGANDMALLATNHNYWFGRPTAGIAIQLNQCFSRGELTIPSTDPYHDPHIESNLCVDERDLLRMEDALQRVRELLAHPAFTRIATGKPIVPETREQIQLQARDVMHLCSTARMGRQDDPGAVVDGDCRVLGVDGLRTIDASVMPDVVCANINLTVIAIAELVAARMRGANPPPVALGQATGALALEVVSK